MKASALQEFLSKLSHSLVTLGVPPKSLEHLESVARALEPLNDIELEQLPGFFKRAAEYRDDGKISAESVPGLEDVRTATRSLDEAMKAVGEHDPASIKALDEQIARGQQQLQVAIKAIAANYGLSATLKSNATWLTGLRQKATMDLAAKGVVKSFQELRAQIAVPASYQSPVVQAAVGHLATNEAEVLKQAANTLGVTDVSTGRKFDSRKFVDAVLLKLTGVEPPAPPRTPKPRATVPVRPDASSEQVEAMIVNLQEMVEKAKDPSAVKDSDIETILGRVRDEFPPEQQKTIAKRVTGKSGRSGEGAIENLRSELTAIKRALESQKV